MTTNVAASPALPSPVTVEGAYQPEVSRWLWLVKWFLAIPHYFCLLVLGIGAVFVWLWALIMIVATGRYPRGAFDYLLGVMRWSWRVLYYLYNVAGTDAYPPFTLADVPDYPARLDVRYPERLSRGLALVKWWLLAIPHYLILAALFGVTNSRRDDTGQIVSEANWPGLVPIMVLIALVIVLFTGIYPKQLHDVIMGFNRWRYRVIAYAALMTDEYPPFRLDQGPYEPEGPHFTEQPREPQWPPNPPQDMGR